MTRKQMKDELRTALSATRSIARHGRASADLKAARATIKDLLNRMAGIDGEDVPEAEVRAALSAHGRACQGHVPARGPRRS